MKQKPRYIPWATLDTVYRFTVLQVAKTKGVKYAIEFQGFNLELPFKPKKSFVEITTKELLLAFSHH